MDHHRQLSDVRPSSQTLAVIPARSASTRLPGKLLLRETGKSVLQHTFESTNSANLLDEVIIAAADEAIAEEAMAFGAAVVMTDPDLPSGTDRVAAVARSRPDAKLLVNIQGDEPELSSVAIDAAVAALQQCPQAMMSTLATPICIERDLHDPACVKVVFDDHGRALYFSRSPIPFARDGITTKDLVDCPRFFQHIGLYVYRRELLLRLAASPVSALEQIEGLEQLRVLAAGETIRVVVVDHAASGIDTAEDYRRFVTRMSA